MDIWFKDHPGKLKVPHNRDLKDKCKEMATTRTDDLHRGTQDKKGDPELTPDQDFEDHQEIDGDIHLHLHPHQEDTTTPVRFHNMAYLQNSEEHGHHAQHHHNLHNSLPLRIRVKEQLYKQ